MFGRNQSGQVAVVLLNFELKRMSVSSVAGAHMLTDFSSKFCVFSIEALSYETTRAQKIFARLRQVRPLSGKNFNFATRFSSKLSRFETSGFVLYDHQNLKDFTVLLGPGGLKFHT